MSNYNDTYFETARQTAQIAADAWQAYIAAQDAAETARQAYIAACDTNADCATTIEAIRAWDIAYIAEQAARFTAWQARDIATDAADEARNAAWWEATRA